MASGQGASRPLRPSHPHPHGALAPLTLQHGQDRMLGRRQQHEGAQLVQHACMHDMPGDSQARNLRRKQALRSVRMLWWEAGAGRRAQPAQLAPPRAVDERRKWLTLQVCLQDKRAEQARACACAWRVMWCPAERGLVHVQHRVQGLPRSGVRGPAGKHAPHSQHALCQPRMGPQRAPLRARPGQQA